MASIQIVLISCQYWAQYESHALCIHAQQPTEFLVIFSRWFSSIFSEFDTWFGCYIIDDTKGTHAQKTSKKICRFVINTINFKGVSHVHWKGFNLIEQRITLAHIQMGFSIQPNTKLFKMFGNEFMNSVFLFQQQFNFNWGHFIWSIILKVLFSVAKWKELK